jgi:hypothetical protein
MTSRPEAVARFNLRTTFRVFAEVQVIPNARAGDTQ